MSRYHVRPSTLPVIHNALQATQYNLLNQAVAVSEGAHAKSYVKPYDIHHIY